jgi:hypothetical protein
MTEAPEPASRVRALRGPDGRVRVYSGPAACDVEGQTRFHADGAHGAALDHLLGALAADVVLGLAREATRAGVGLHAVEARLSGVLGNPLVALGVVGESGSPGLTVVSGSLYVGTDAPDETMRELWTLALARAPVFATLSRCATVHIELKCMP